MPGGPKLNATVFDLNTSLLTLYLQHNDSNLDDMISSLGVGVK